jgi:hypothetical protein
LKLHFISYHFLSLTEIGLNTRKLCQLVGMVIGFALIDYGFNLIAVGLPGAREMTSQLIGVNVLLGGSAVVFISLFFLLRPAQASIPTSKPESGAAPGIGIETVVEEQAPPQFRFYKNIEYVGYFMTALGLFAAIDLVLQILIPQMYNEVRWWVEVLLVIFGVLAYAIFGSLGRIGAEEERGLVTAQRSMASSETSVQIPEIEPKVQIPEVIELHLNQFSQSSSGEYERKLTDFVYDMVTIGPKMINVWRESRAGMRSAYLAGPYELSSELLNEHAKNGEPIRIGILSISIESIQELLGTQRELQAQVAS